MNLRLALVAFVTVATSAFAADDWVNMLAADPTGGLVTGRYCYSTNGKDISCDAGAALRVASDTLYIPVLSAPSIGAGDINASGQITATAVGATLISATAATGTVTSTFVNAYQVSATNISTTALYVNGVAVTGGGGGTPGGADTEVQYNSSGAYAGDAAFTYSGGLLTLTGTITATNIYASSVSGSTGTFGSIGAGAIAMTGNLTGAPLISTSSGGIVTSTFVNAYQVSATNISATTITAATYYGDASHLSNLPAGATDRISTSGVASGATLGMVVADKGTISFTTGGTEGTAYLDTTGRYIGPGISITTAQTSVTSLYTTGAVLVSGNDINLDNGKGLSASAGGRIATGSGGKTFGAYAGQDGGIFTFNTAASATIGIVDSLGNFGVSTTSPNAKLDVIGIISASNVYVTGTTGTVSATFGYFGNISATNATVTDITATGYYYGNGSRLTGVVAAPAGLDTYVQYNSGGSSMGAEAAFTYDPATDTLTAVNIAGTLATAAQPNITSVGTLTGLTVTGVITATSGVGTVTATNVNAVNVSATNGSIANLGVGSINASEQITATAVGATLISATAATGTVSATNVYARSVSGTTGTFGSLSVGGATATTGSGSSGRVAYWNGANSLTSDANFTYGSGMLTQSGTATVYHTMSSSAAYEPQVTLTGTYNGDASTYLIFGRKRGSAIVQNGDHIGTVLFQGWNGTGYNYLASIDGVIDGTPGASNDMPGRLIFSTATDGTGSIAERMRIDSSGNVGIGTSSPVGLFSTYFGTAGAPATSGSSDPNISWRMRVQSIALDFGTYSSGVTWIQNRLFDNYTGNYGLALNPNGGNVGIGTTSPNAKLDVNGTVSATTVVASTVSSSLVSATYISVTTLQIGSGGTCDSARTGVLRYSSGLSFCDGSSWVPLTSCSVGSWSWLQKSSTTTAAMFRAIASSSDGSKLVAAAGGGASSYLYTSTDGGATWTQRDSSRAWTNVASSSDGTKLAATVYGGYIYTSTDSGVTWSTNSNSSGSRGWYHNITSSSDGTKLAAIVLNSYLFTSTNSGASWTQRTPTYVSGGVKYNSDGTKLAILKNDGIIYTSTDDGANFTALFNCSCTDFTMSDDGNIFIAVDNGTNFRTFASINAGSTFYSQQGLGSSYLYQENTSINGYGNKSLYISGDGTKAGFALGTTVYSSSMCN